jgi:hypothetical protein
LRFEAIVSSGINPEHFRKQIFGGGQRLLPTYEHRLIRGADRGDVHYGAHRGSKKVARGRAARKL